MATTIGRVEFLVGLDGKGLPAQAQKIAKQIELAGKKAGRDFGNAFDAEFDQRMSDVGDRVAGKLSESGKLAGNTFADDFNGAVSGKFRRIQANLAEILSDKEAFRDYAGGFDTVDQAVSRITADLERLRKEEVSWQDANGKTQSQAVLTWNEFQSYSKAARDLGRELEAQNRVQKRLEMQTAALREESDRIEQTYLRLGKLTGDKSAFVQMSKDVGSTEKAFNQLKTNIEETGAALGRSQLEIDGFVDQLERTREGVDETNASFDGMEHRTSRLDSAFHRLGQAISSPWRHLDNDVRLVIGLIASAADQIAVLGSAAGAGFIAVGGAAAQAVVGAGALVPVFISLASDLEDLPPNLREVASEFQALGRSFSQTRLVISEAAFAEMGGVFASLGDSVRELDPVFSKLGTTVGSVFADFAKAVEPGSEALEEVQKLISHSADNFDDLAGTVGQFGLALIRSFNRAEPLVEDFIGWIDNLVDRFDDFTQSNGFDIWIANAQRVFGSFGGLLDSVGRGLNNLASSDAVDRTTALLDNLSGFVGPLTQILDILGTLDPLGLLAELLNDVGAALMPLMPSLRELATALNEMGMGVIDGLAEGFGNLALALIPVVEGLADLVGAVPEGWWNAIGSGLVAVTAGFLAFKGAAGVAGAITALNSFIATAGKTSDAAKRMNAGLAKLGGTAALAGTVLIIGQIQKGIEDSIPSTKELEATFNGVGTAAEGFASAFERGGFETFWMGDYADQLKDVGSLLDKAKNSQNEWLDLTFNEQGAIDSIRRYGEAINQVASTDLPAAQTAFSELRVEYDLTSAQSSELLSTMEPFKDTLIDQAKALGVSATEANLLALATGTLTPEMALAAAATQNQADELLRMEGKSYDAGFAIDGLADKIRNFGSATLDSREAERQFQEAVDAVSASVAANGAVLDINTAAGRQNEAALDAVAQSALDSAAATYVQTGSVEDATVAVQAGRDALIDQLAQFGITGEAAELYADNLGLIPEDVPTLVALLGVPEAETALNDLTADRTVNIVTNVRGGGYGRDTTPMARGGVLTGPTNVLAGEAGREAFVPLDRPLSQIDPSVRALAAFAQGKPHMASGGIVGASRSITIAPGAIVVMAAEDPAATALAVLNRVAEMV